uniref:Uncharacterized protein n=1 Tax=Rhizophora mucronata TaxID=61149 RepID=A0A2P2PX47_RHIMU
MRPCALIKFIAHSSFTSRYPFVSTQKRCSNLSSGSVRTVKSVKILCLLDSLKGIAGG